MVYQPYKPKTTKLVISKIIANFAGLLSADRKYLISQLVESIIRPY